MVYLVTWIQNYSDFISSDDSLYLYCKKGDKKGSNWRKKETKKKENSIMEDTQMTKENKNQVRNEEPKACHV